MLGGRFAPNKEIPMYKNIPLLFIAIILFSCNKQQGDILDSVNLTEQIIGIWDIHKKDNSNESMLRFYKNGNVILMRSDYEQVKLNEVLREQGQFTVIKDGILINITEEIILINQNTTNLMRNSMGWTYDQELKVLKERSFIICKREIYEDHGQMFLTYNSKLLRKISSDPNKP